MPIGLIINCLVVLIGGIIGKVIGDYLDDKLKEKITVILGICSMSVGIVNAVKVYALTPVIFAILAGYVIGEFCGLEKKISKAFSFILKKLPIKNNIDMDTYVMVVVLFCASGFGIFGVLTEGMSGNSTILLSKSAIDFFTAVIFGTTLGLSVSIISVPQFIIFMLLFMISKFIAPVITKYELMDFVACGGILTIAAGLRVAQIKKIAIGNMIPALILVIPLSYLWHLIM